MFQLKYNNDLNIVDDIPCLEVENIPDKVLVFIKKVLSDRVIYDKKSNFYYCGNCASKLNKNNYCSYCNTNHKLGNLKDNKNVIIKDTSNYLFELESQFFFFSVLDKNVILYCINEATSYILSSNVPYKKSTLSINKKLSFFVNDKGIMDLESLKFLSFKYLDKCIVDYDNGVETLDVYGKLETFNNTIYLYLDNLEILKNTVYRYSKIWQLKEYYQKKETFILSELIFYPLYYKQYEYLVNYHLYNLATTCPYVFKKGKNFKEIFGLDKKYLSFMIDNDIKYSEYQLLCMFPSLDIDVIKYFADDVYFFEHMKDIKLDLKKIKLCIESNNSDIQTYFDYLYMAKELKLDLKDPKVLYTKRLIEEHDKLYEQIEVAENPLVERKIKALSNILSFNKYEDENYIIYPVSSIKEIVEESREQKNCVRAYLKRIAFDTCQIYFMRKKENPKKSFVTIEVLNKKIVQAYTKYNQVPDKEALDILNKWEKTLLPISYANNNEEIIV